MNRSIRTFVVHYFQMVLAMVVGMAAILPIWSMVTAGATRVWLGRVETDILVMASSMAIGMGGWMWFRGHRPREVAEMVASMYAPFVVLYPLLRIGVLDGAGLMVWGHLLMLPAMLVAMVARLDTYARPHHAHRAHASSARS